MKKIRQGQTRWTHIKVLGGELSDQVTIYIVRCFAVQVTHYGVLLAAAPFGLPGEWERTLPLVSHQEWRTLPKTFRRAMRDAETRVRKIDRDRLQEFGEAWGAEL